MAWTVEDIAYHLGESFNDLIGEVEIEECRERFVLRVLFRVWRWPASFKNFFEQLHRRTSEMVPAGIGIEIPAEIANKHGADQLADFILENGELPTWGELVTMEPEMKEKVVELFKHLDQMRVAQQTLIVDQETDGVLREMEAEWTPSSNERKEIWDTITLEFLIPRVDYQQINGPETYQASKFIGLIRSCLKMQDRTGDRSYINRMEKRNQEVEEELVENVAFIAKLRSVIHHLLDGTSQMRPKLFKEAMSVLNGDKLGKRFLESFRNMQKAVAERRPDVAAELISKLDDIGDAW